MDLSSINSGMFVGSILALAVGLRLISNGSLVKGIVGFLFLAGGVIYGIRSLGFIEAPEQVWAALVVGLLASYGVYQFVKQGQWFVGLLSLVVAIICVRYFNKQADIPALQAFVDPDNPAGNTLGIVWTWVKSIFS